MELGMLYASHTPACLYRALREARRGGHRCLDWLAHAMRYLSSLAVSRHLIVDWHDVLCSLEIEPGTLDLLARAVISSVFALMPDGVETQSAISTLATIVGERLWLHSDNPRAWVSC